MAFPNVDLLRELTRGSEWRRWARLGLLLTAVAALVVGMARPQMAVSVPKKHATIVLAMDVSGSMVADDVSPSRLAAATAAAQAFVKDLPETFEVSLVPFSSNASVAVAPTRDREAIRKALADLQPDGGTAIGEAILRSLVAAGAPVNAQTPAQAQKDKGARVVLLLSDGQNSVGTEPMTAAAAAARTGTPVYTIAFGTEDGVVYAPDGSLIPVPPDPDTLKRVSDATGGTFFSAADASSLRKVYDRIGTRVGSTTEQRDVTWAFAAAGAVLLLSAGALGVAWRGRLP